MNYAWEAALSADQAGISREEIRFVSVRNESPYTEITMEHINSRGLGKKYVERNPINQLSREFSALFDRNLEGYEKVRQLLFDAVMQYFVQLDLHQGLSKQEYALRFLLKDLQGGVCGSSIYLFREVMRCMFTEFLVYASNKAVRQVLVYVGVKEKEGEMLEFLEDMFLPINYQMFLFWELHFGIMDVVETMELYEMVLF